MAAGRRADDPLRRLTALHPTLEVTSGFRAPEYQAQMRRRGYRPARNSKHLRGDGLDIVANGVAPRELERDAAAIFGKDAVLNEGDHIHIGKDGYGGGLPVRGLPGGFEIDNGSAGPTLKAVVTKRAGGSPTGQVHDGDTFKLTSGHNARLFGVDAYELNQAGRRPDNSLEPLGKEARGFLSASISPDTPLNFTGAQTYGRPVVTVGDLKDDPVRGLVRHGFGLAEPDYVKGDPRFAPYMEAERLARLNLLGGHGTNAETPSQFRHKDGPWAGAEPGKYGEGIAVFGDEPTPFQGLRPEIEKGYLSIWTDPKSKPDDLLAYAKANGFELSPDDVRNQYAGRDKGGKPESAIRYGPAAPRLLTDPGDAATGAALRGLADPINFIDELGGVADTLGIGGNIDGPRETLLNSERRFGDILWNNIDQNRSILAHDEEHHPIARIGGQVASAVVLPFGAGARTPMALARLGALEGLVGGAGAGEDAWGSRYKNALLGTVAGGIGGAALGHAANVVAPAWLRARNGVRRLFGRDSGPARAAPGFAPSTGSEPRSASMRMDNQSDELVGPVVRQRDYLDVGGSGPPAGFEVDPFGPVRPAGERLSPEAMAALAQDVDPRSVLPRPGNMVDDLSEAQRANPGTFRELQTPDEFAELGVRKILTPKGQKTWKRGPDVTTRVRGPLDITQTLRTYGGIKDDGGELAHLGIDGKPRRLPFGGNEGFLGKLIDNERGLPLDEATHRLWEEGYFPEFRNRPTPADLLNKLSAESHGERFFHPDSLDEVASYQSAQADRYRIEEAANEGAPLVEDVGDNITLDDLVANEPPIDAYDERPRLVGKIGNINLAHIANFEDVAQLISQVQQRVGGFSAAQRGRITHDETLKLAQDRGLKPEQLLKRQAGQALNAEQLYASRILVQKSREVVARMASKAVGGSDDDLATFRAAWLRHVALEEQVSGATAEAGRALSQMRALARGSDARGDVVRDYLKGSGGRESIEVAARAIVDLMEDPAKASHFMREAVKPRWRDKLNELWINSLLSGPKTHVVNFVGNALTTVLAMPEQALTAGIGKLTRSADRSTIGEVGARMSGLANAAVDGISRARRAFITGEASDASTKIDAIHQHAIGGTVGKIVRIPTRALTAADEFWKAINSSAELHQLAFRKADQEGGDAATRKARYEALLRNPSEEMVGQSEQAARYYTFQKELGASGRAVQQWANNTPGAKIILPFIRTPINLLKFAGERSLFALLMPEVRGAIWQGGRVRDEALARITIGAGLSTAAVTAALEGKMSGGGPSDPQEQAALRQSGWQPYSVRIGDQWVSYQRFDPLSILAGAAADFAEVGRYATDKEKDAFAQNLGLAIAKNVTNKTWLSGLSDFFEMMSDPDRYGAAWFRKQAASAAVPTLFAQSAQSIDPHLRDARTMLDAIKSRVPVLSKSVPVKRNVWGDAVERGDAVGPDILSPVYASQASRDPVNVEIARLRAPVSMPQRYMRIDGKRVDLTPQQYDELVQLSGQPAKKHLQGVMASPDWRRMRDDERQAVVKDALKEFRAAGRAALKERHPELAGADEDDEPQRLFKTIKDVRPAIPAPPSQAAPPEGFEMDR